MNLPKPPDQYDARDQVQMRGIVEREDKRNLKTGMIFDSLLLRDSVTGAVRTLTVAGGALVVS